MLLWWHIKCPLHLCLFSRVLVCSIYLSSQYHFIPSICSFRNCFIIYSSLSLLFQNCPVSLVFYMSFTIRLSKSKKITLLFFFLNQGHLKFIGQFRKVGIFMIFLPENVTCVFSSLCACVSIACLSFVLANCASFLVILSLFGCYYRLRSYLISSNHLCVCAFTLCWLIL